MTDSHDDNGEVEAHLRPLPLRCVECRRRWRDPGERWRIYVTADEPPESVVYCPDCATREFDD